MAHFPLSFIPAWRPLAGCLCALLLVAAPKASRAQDWIGMSPMDYANMNSSFANTVMMNGVIERLAGADRKGSRTTPAKPTPKKTASTASFAYTVTPAQRAAARDAYLASLSKTNASLAASLRTQFQKTDYDAIYAGLLAGTGLQNNNLADALAAYTVLGWMIVNRQTSDPSTAAYAGVRQQWANALAGSSNYANPASRRATAEELKIKTVLLHAGWKDAAQTAGVAAYAQSIDRLYQSQMKLKLTSMAIGPTGLVAR